MQGFMRQAAWALDSQEAAVWQKVWGLITWLQMVLQD